MVVLTKLIVVNTLQYTHRSHINNISIKLEKMNDFCVITFIPSYGYNVSYISDTYTCSPNERIWDFRLSSCVLKGYQAEGAMPQGDFSSSY